MPRAIGLLCCYELEGCVSARLLGLHSAYCRVCSPSACAIVMSMTTRGLSLLAALHCPTGSKFSMPRQRADSHVASPGACGALQ